MHQPDAARRPSRATKRSTKRSLLALSHAMERSIDVGREWVPDGQSSLIISLFQRRHYFDVERERYAQLAADARTCIVAFSGPVDDLPPGVHGVALDDTEMLACEWVLIVLDGGLGTSLVARDIDDLLPGADTLEAGRLFEGRWSFSTADAIDEAQRILDALGERLPDDVVASAREAINAASASRVSLAERRLAAVTDVLVSSVDDAYFRAERMEGLARREKELSEHDPLTGLANRRFLDRFMTLNEHDAPMRMAALLVDLDGLKSINDEHSHLAGDLAIQYTARVLTEVTRPQDVVVRMGGDEFLILLPGVGEDEAVRVGTRIVARIGTTCLPEPWRQVGLGASVGVQVASADGIDLGPWTPRSTAPSARARVASTWPDGRRTLWVVRARGIPGGELVAQLRLTLLHDPPDRRARRRREVVEQDARTGPGVDVAHRAQRRHVDAVAGIGPLGLGALHVEHGLPAHHARPPAERVHVDRGARARLADVAIHPHLLAVAHEGEDLGGRVHEGRLARWHGAVEGRDQRHRIGLGDHGLRRRGA